ncbi:hypothetical protein [Candidatus Poriferisodalis multihospitum]|uniref:hypothetical protein n=1 Tax=Candidatus Poriferisodalis multihospitum TaxID=2983191 RepID=UPI002B25B232|nr:hypothetical protein [Candidatus Poriferisodalis multihospitum]
MEMLATLLRRGMEPGRYADANEERCVKTMALPCSEAKENYRETIAEAKQMAEDDELFGGTPTGEQMRLPVPRGAPRFGCAMSDERLVNSVAEHHFEPSEVFVQGCCRPEVPVVERDS